MALTLAEYAPPGTDIAQSVRLLLVYDLVEIGAGDLHFDASPEARVKQARAEAQAASQLFGQLPEAQAADFLSLWHEFEAQQTPEARFARALDALQPMMLTWGQRPGGPQGQGCSDRAPEVTAQRVLELKRGALADCPELWQAAQEITAAAVRAGVVAAR